MFGYVIGNRQQMTEADLKIYRGCYCGLCRMLKKRWGAIYRLTVNYDLTFLILLLSALDQTEEKVSGQERCIAHPFSTHDYWYNLHTEYAADMNIALVYNNLIDDWLDDRSYKGRIKAWFLRRPYRKLQKDYPKQCALITDCMRQLKDLEDADENRPDLPADCFGRMLAGIFSPEQTDSQLWRMAYNLGCFIYIMDAAVDLPRDIKKGKYNPLIFAGTVDFRPHLLMLIGACTEDFEKLPLMRYQSILRNILYSGVWIKYEMARGENKPRKEK
jgi:hypothetical protein